jgi:hypothetical protein
MKTTRDEWVVGYETFFSVPPEVSGPLFDQLELPAEELRAAAHAALAPLVSGRDLEVAVGAALCVQTEEAFARGELS